jgi:porin
VLEKKTRARLPIVALVGALALAAPAALAEEVDFGADGLPVHSVARNLFAQSDANSARRTLAERGITYNIFWVNDVLANISGGQKRGAIAQGKFDGALSIDFEKFAAWKGLSFYTNFFAIYNTGRMRRDYVGGINTIAEIEATPTVRLSELWLEQKFAGDKASLRFGQLTADTEFFYADVSKSFLQSDWPTITAANLPSGGPAYPLSTPGVRLKVDPNEQLTLLFAIYNGDPSGAGFGDDAELRNRYGLNFRVNDPPLVMSEAQFKTNQKKEDAGLSSTFKFGGWGHFGRFDDQRYADDGLLLADPLSSRVPLLHRGTWGVYATAEQQLYRPKGGGPEDGISVFSRIAFSPTDRSPISFYADGGIVFDKMLAARPNDKFGVSVMYARFSDRLRQYDQDLIDFGTPGYVRDYEMNIEFNYLWQIANGWTVQPIVTYVWHPGGEPGKHAIVTGVRSIWRY